MSEKSFNTLIESNGFKSSSDRWYPHKIDNYKASLKIWGDSDDVLRIKSNFAYSMQYIQYLEKQLNELKLSDVVKIMICKSYIITGMSIIEALFTNLLYRTNNWNTSTWEEYSAIVSNPKKIDGVNIKIETHLLKEVDEYEMRMDLDSMIKRIEKKGLLTIEHSAFPALKKLRELRNRVHLQIGDGPYDHDYNCFGCEEIQMMRRILYAILTSDEFCNNDKVYEFLKTSYINNGGSLDK